MQKHFNTVVDAFKPIYTQHRYEYKSKKLLNDQIIKVIQYRGLVIGDVANILNIKVKEASWIVNSKLEYFTLAKLQKLALVFSIDLENQQTSTYGMGPVHPGDILLRDFMEGEDSSASAAALMIDCGDISEKVLCGFTNGKVDVNAHLASLFSIHLGTTEELWLNLQRDYNLSVLRQIAKGSKLRGN